MWALRGEMNTHVLLSRELIAESERLMAEVDQLLACR
jgi:hypothetical protein